jgi:hypothetical protein
MIKAINYKFDGGTASTTPLSSYDETKVNLSSLMRIYTGLNPKDKFAGPMKIGMARPMEASTQIAGIYPHVYAYSSTIDWVFLFDNATAAATRRVILYECNKTTSEFNWVGFVLLTFPTATAHTIRGARVSVNLYTTGTASVSGTSVTGVGTSWTTDEMNVGSRIGFGSTDPTQITTWYEISAVGGNTSITLTVSGGTIDDGPYVIQDMMILITTTNATPANGGLFVAKGVSHDSFSAQITIPAAVSTDNIRAVYWIADAATVINTASCGCALGSFTSWTNQLCYVIDTNRRVYIYNFRKALTVASGKDTTGTVITTGVLTSAFTGTISQANNSRVGVLSHGPGLGVESLYFVTTTRIYRAAISSLTAGNTSWTSDIMVEIPPGGANTYTATSALTSVEISATIDRLVVTTTGAAGVRSYVTRYNTISDPMDHIFLVDDKQLDQSLADSGGAPHPAILALPFSAWSEGGILYLCRVGTTAAQIQIYTLPIGAHRYYVNTTLERLITPKFDISDSTVLYNVYTSAIDELGDDTFSLPTEPYDVWYRTTGISDNSGVWTMLDQLGTLSGVSGTSIQFSFTFKILGATCIPARINAISLIYEDQNNDSHYEPSFSNSSASTNVFAYRQGTTWGSNIPNLRIRLWNIDTGVSVLDDTILLSSFGTWEYSTNNGSSWNTWDAAQDAVGNYIRYSASSLPGGIRVRALLTQV